MASDSAIFQNRVPNQEFDLRRGLKMMKQKTVMLVAAVACLALLLGGVAVGLAVGQTTTREMGVVAAATAFTYQGRLDGEGGPANGAYDFEFRLYPAASGDDQVGPTVSHSGVVLNQGLFTVLLDFGANAFSGQARYLEIRVRPSGGGDFITLAPRQALTATPYAIYSQAAPWQGLIGVPDGFADGVDDDTLAGLTCSNGQVAKWDGSAWHCAADNDTTYAAGTGLVLAGNEFSAQGSPYGNVLVVAQSGGDFSSVQAALNSITDAGAANPYLVYVAPGVYTEQVTLKPYVTLAGAGEGVTILRWTGGSQHPVNGSGSATLVGADNAGLRHLSVVSEGTGQSYAVAIYNNHASPDITHVTAMALDGSNNLGVFNGDGSSPAMTHVTATATGGNFENRGVFNDGSSPTMLHVTATGSGGSFSVGVYNFSSSPMMTNVTAIASDGSNLTFGVYNSESSPTMTHVTVMATGGGFNRFGVHNVDSSPTIRDSLIEGVDYSISDSFIGTVKVANSQLIGPISSGLICFNNYDANLNPVNCPP
jgi:hypothetical protein